MGHRVLHGGGSRAAILKGMAEDACRETGQALWYDLAVQLHAKVSENKKYPTWISLGAALLFDRITVDIFTPVIARRRGSSADGQSPQEQYDDNRIYATEPLQGTGRKALRAVERNVGMGSLGRAKMIDSTRLRGKAVRRREIGLRVDQCLLTDKKRTWRGCSSRQWASPASSQPACVVSYIDHNVNRPTRHTDDHSTFQRRPRATARGSQWGKRNLPPGALRDLQYRAVRARHGQPHLICGSKGCWPSERRARRRAVAMGGRGSL